MCEESMMENSKEKQEQKSVKEKKKCFVMMPISDQKEYAENHFTKVYSQIFKPAIEDAGYEAIRVDEDKMSSDIITKILNYIQNSDIALCDLSAKNPNVLYELGLAQAYDKKVVLVKDNRTEYVFDVSGISTVEYRAERLYEHVEQARKDISDAISATAQRKNNTILEMVKVRAASIDTSEPDSHDTQNYMLNMLEGIQRQLAELKMSKQRELSTQRIGYITEKMCDKEMNDQIRFRLNDELFGESDIKTRYLDDKSYDDMLKNSKSNKMK